MEISFANKQIQKICTDEKTARKELGRTGAKILERRLAQMTVSENLAELRFSDGSWHELSGNRKGELACSLLGLKRLVFVPANNPTPAKPDGGLDWSKITAVMNVEIVDYH